MFHKSLVIKGIKEDENEEKEQTMEKVVLIMQKIGVEINATVDLEEVIRMGKQKDSRVRPILIKGIRAGTRTKIFMNTRLLRGTDIWIEEDLPKKVQEERKLLIGKMKEARQNGLRAFIRYNKLIIEKSEQKGETSSGKRTVLERSPEGDSLQEQLRKITRTSWRKN